MERLTDHLFDWLKAMATPRLPLRLIEHRCDVDLVDADGNRADADTLYYAKEAANALPLLIAEIERLREQNRELRKALRPFARAADDPKYHTLVLSYSSRENVPTDDDFRRAKALLEKEG